MSLNQRYTITRNLLGLSFLLLIGVVVIWWKIVYENKIDELDAQARYEWVQALRAVEKEHYQQFFEFAAEGSENNLTVKMQPKEKRDSLLARPIKRLQIRQSEMISHSSGTSKDSISTIIIIKQNTTSIDSTSLEEGIKESIDPDQFQLDEASVRERFAKAMGDRSLPLSFQIEISSDSFDNLDEVSQLVAQLQAGDQFSLATSYTWWGVLGNMWLELILGVLLLAVLGFAFYYSLKVWREQQALQVFRQELISNITHELRTPIFTVGATLEALESFNLLENKERSKEYLGIARKELERLSDMVSNVLQTSLLGEQALPLQQVSLSIASILQDRQQAFHLIAQQQNANIKLQLVSPDLEIWADPTHLTAMLTNLIDNALKYGKETPNLQIELNAKRSQQHLLLEVADNGPGIPKAYQNKLFEKFFRVPQHNQHNVKGHGLGLHYVAMMMQQHGGEVLVSSQEGQGSRFTLVFPLTGG